MSYLKILKEDSFWWVMLGFVWGIYLGQGYVFEQIGTDWASFYEIPWHPFLVQLFVLAMNLTVMVLFIAIILLIAEILRLIREIIGRILKKAWNNVKKR